ncbi:hypothetical protein KFE25_013541 [Diacronema lutheri]|uniref:Uncharacterized protein n=1 Tax=Diacronema lutheri TaxID=2081491 RepID=A0A8J6CI56_DIALT|nr:hypothetical protein KFE25_013541 [Diacronema lutheri]
MLDPNARRAERSEAVPPLQQLCIGVLVVAARRMSSTTVTLERSNAALLERKLELQIELAEVSQALEDLHVARRQIAEATRTFANDVRTSLDPPLDALVLARLAEVHPLVASSAPPARNLGGAAAPHGERGAVPSTSVTQDQHHHRSSA